MTIGQLINSGLFENTKTAKEEYSNAEEDEKIRLSKYENEINSYIDGNRDYETEINSLKAEINNLKSIINNFQYAEIASSNKTVAYNTAEKLYTKEFLEDRLICCSMVRL